MMGRRISDTRTMRWEIYYVHPQSDRRLFLDTLRQAPADSIRYATTKIYIPQHDSRISQF